MDFVCSFILKFNVESAHRQIDLEDFQVCIDCLWYFSLKRENKHSEDMKVTNHIKYHLHIALEIFLGLENVCVI